MALLLAGCSVGEDYVQPKVETPPAWQTSVAESPPEWPSADWWRRFGSKRLDELMARAQEANFDIAAAVARVRQADAQLRVSGAALLPTLDGTTSGERQRTTFGPSTLANTTTRAPLYNTFSADLSASYEIDFWGKNRASRDAAEASARQSRFDQRTAQLTVQSSVATTYFDMAGQSARLAVARESVANAERVLEVIRDRLAAGTATALDVAQQESVVATQRATIAPIEQQIRQDANALAILTARLPQELTTDTEYLGEIALPAVQPGLPSELLQRRPDVQSAEQQLVAANANITNARAQLFPSISLTGTGGFSSVALDTLFMHTGLLYSLAASVTQSIFDGGKLEGQVDLTRARYDELVQTYRKTVLTAFSDVENALVAVRKTRELEDAQRASEATARNAAAIAEDQLRAGTVDITTVLNTQKTLFSAQDALASARLSHLQAVVGLYKAMGGGWEGR